MGFFLTVLNCGGLHTLYHAFVLMTPHFGRRVKRVLLIAYHFPFGWQPLVAQDFIERYPAIPYRTALAEMLLVVALLVMQACNCNIQIPVKIYEKLRAGQPSAGPDRPVGDAAGVLREAGPNDMARLDSVAEIEQVLLALVRDWRRGKAALLKALTVQHASRRGRCEAFVEWLNQVLFVKFSVSH